MKRYVCDQPGCGEEFANDRGLAIHRSSHSRAKQECPRCGKFFVYLDSHLSKVHRTNVKQLLESVQDLAEELLRIRDENEVLKGEILMLRKASKGLDFDSSYYSHSLPLLERGRE